MDVWQLPADLAALEHELRRLPFREPPRLLDSQVLAAVERHLQRDHLRGWGWFASAAAAALALWANLSWTACRETSCILRGTDGGGVTSEQIERLVPGISRHETLRQVLILGGAAKSAAASPGRRLAGPHVTNSPSPRSFKEL